MIEFDCDRVIVENVEIKRPSRISRIQWLEFWEWALVENKNPDDVFESAMKWQQYNRVLDEKKKAI